MKIALINPFSFTYQGGVQEHVKALYRFLKSRGEAVKVIAPRQAREEFYGEDFLLLGSSVIIPGNDSRVNLSYALPAEIEEVLRRESFDLLHFHSFMPFLSFQILDAVKVKGVAKVMTSHSNIEGSFFATALPGITEFVIDSFVDRMDAVICVSQAAQKLVRRFKGLKTIIPNGVDLARFSAGKSRRKEFADGKRNILFVGRLDRRKGMQILLPAFALLRKKFSDIRLIVVGEGFLREELLAAVGRERIEDVVFVGEVKAENTPSYYGSADIFCAPSIRGETFGIILLEAMGSGLPVVASNIEGYAEVMPTLAKRFLVTPGEPVLLSRALEELLTDSDLRQRMRELGILHSRQYDWEVVGGRIRDFYGEVIKMKAKS